MPRTVDPRAHAHRRDAFVDAAQRLIQTKGYERMSIQDVLDDLGVSRGALYHYFDSKEALLDAVVERGVDAALESVAGVADGGDLDAPARLERFFAGLVAWKTERGELMRAIAQAWTSDGNLIARERYRQHVTARVTPALAAILAQGAAEGTFRMASPDVTAGILVALVLTANETLTRLWLAIQGGDGGVTLERVERTVAAFTEAYERVLGLAPGSWPAIDARILRDWFTATPRSTTTKE
jgi:AcrR family transcriptional regulator